MTLTLVLKKGFPPMNIYGKYESSITYHSKAMAICKSFWGQTNGLDKQTDRQKTICPQSNEAGIKICKTRLRMFFRMLGEYAW